MRSNLTWLLFSNCLPNTTHALQNHTNYIPYGGICISISFSPQILLSLFPDTFDGRRRNSKHPFLNRSGFGGRPARQLPRQSHCSTEKKTYQVGGERYQTLCHPLTVESATDSPKCFACKRCPACCSRVLLTFVPEEKMVTVACVLRYVVFINYYRYFK